MVITGINRIELIDHATEDAGRKFVKYSDDMVIEIVAQDDGKTIKIFILPKDVLDKIENV